MKSICFVVCGLDSHLDRIKLCTYTIEYVYKDKYSIGLATFGNKAVAPSNNLKKYAEQCNYYFYDAPRQWFIPSDREWYSCEILGMVTISKYFYDLGFDEVYLLHNDVFVVREFLSPYKQQMINNWNFICPFIYIKQSKLSYKEILTYDSFEIYNKKIPARLTQSIVVFNKEFILSLYNRYNNEKQMWDDYFVNLCMFGDIGLFNVAQDFLGYTANPLDMKYTIDGGCWNKSTVIKSIINDKNICFIHGPEKFDFLKNKIKYVLKEIR